MRNYPSLIRPLLMATLFFITAKASSQELSITVAGNKYKIQKDTLYIEIRNEAVNFSLVYTLSGTDLPIDLSITNDKSYTIPAEDIIKAGLDEDAVSLSKDDGYTGRIDFTLPANNEYAEDEYTTLVFRWEDMLKSEGIKEKRLTLKIHKRKHKWLDWVPDPGNTPKLEIIQYTDFLGISSDRPNGAFQQQLLFKWPIVKSHFNINEKVKLQFFRSVLLPNILLNRIDKARDDSSMLVPLGRSIVQRPNSTTPDTVSNVVGSFDMIRYTNTMLESSINIFALQIDNARIYLNYDFGLLRNRIKDTISQPHPVSRPIYSYVTGWHLYAKSLLDRKLELNIEVEAGYRKVRLQDNFFKQYDIYTYENGPTSGVRFPVRNGNARNTSKPIYYVSTELTKYWGEKSTNYVFLRFKYQWQQGNYNFVFKGEPARLQTQRFINHFFQVNLGVSLGLEDLFKKK